MESQNHPIVIGMAQYSLAMSVLLFVRVVYIASLCGELPAI